MFTHLATHSYCSMCNTCLFYYFYIYLLGICVWRPLCNVCIGEQICKYPKLSFRCATKTINLFEFRYRVSVLRSFCLVCLFYCSLCLAENILRITNSSVLFQGPGWSTFGWFYNAHLQVNTFSRNIDINSEFKARSPTC